MPMSPPVHAQPAVQGLLPLIVYAAMAVALIGLLLATAWWLGEKRWTAVKRLPYESGVLPYGSSRLAFPVDFYLIAIFFIVFDVETIFLFVWAVVWHLLGLAGLVHASVFIVVLLFGLAWLWKKGGLEWGPMHVERRRVERRKADRRLTY
jgi:NADH-quinone oxidoreductase subunit A